ncbi:amidohydrolase [Paenibacillus mesophilus]|uniref:amidohydrolase n=1 Tax=Paenibacillus mesophilus TaxID=2582849 RepID=UPI00110E2E40|nr:amidohydrolase [Paenibacillus mesophilus]TMV48731.1 amidohydrolase [Paenibacillus mesophilus]
MNHEERNRLLTGMVTCRRDIHAHPEPGWMEYRTASLVAARLSALGYEVATGEQAIRSEARMGVPDAATLRFHEEKALREGVDPFWLERMKGGHTAVVGVLRGLKPGPVIALRFDMDCVEIGESDAPDHLPCQLGFSSNRSGLMHACGHDGHVAIGLGVAEMIAGRRSELAGEVRLLFQPAEEGCRGAKAMVEVGWLDGADYFLCGHIGLKSRILGEIVASVDGFLSTTKIDAMFRGKEAHAGNSPELGSNALLAACTAALHLHGISRHSEGATRVNVGMLEGGSGRNVIPGEARMKLELRGETEALNEYMARETSRILASAASMYGVSCEWETVGRGISAEGDRSLIPMIEQECAGMDTVVSFVPSIPFGASEDATFMLRKVQEQGGRGVYMLFGSPLAAGHHQSSFDFDERVLGIAAELIVRLVFACRNGAAVSDPAMHTNSKE